MTIHQLINVLVTITLVEMMVAIGLGVTFAELLGVARNWRLVGRAALANYVCVPAAAVGLLLVFAAQPLVAAGFLILAACPGAPFGPPCTSLAKGDVAVSVGLMVGLAGSSSVGAPVLLYFLLPMMQGNQTLAASDAKATLEIDAIKIVVTLLVTQLLPLGAGLGVRQSWPVLADKLQRPANLLSAVLNLATVGVILVAQFQLLMEIRLRAWVGMSALFIVSWAAGWLLGGPEPGIRKAMTLTTSLRNVGVGLVIAAGSFAGTPAVPAALVYGLFEVVGSLLLAFWWARRAPVVKLLDDGVKTWEPSTKAPDGKWNSL